jgi:hypothetical protein
VTDTTPLGRSAGGSSRWRAFFARERGLLTLGVIAALIVCLAIGTFIFFRNLAYGDLVAAREMIAQQQSESQKLNHLVIDQTARLTSLQAKFKNVEETLDSVMPSAHTYNIAPNQTLIVADGHVTVGLIGSPGNEGVVLNINGKPQTVTAGQVVSVTPDASTACQVGVQSFDMFKAVITASCAAPKPQ